jgi:Tol biopolymer transport system component
LTAGLAIGIAATAPADATFPGRNGAIAFAWEGYGGKIYVQSTIYMKRAGHRLRAVRSCVHETLGPGPNDCFTDSPAVSRSGRELAYVAQAIPGDAVAPERSWLELVPVGGGAPARVPLARPSFDAEWSPGGSRLLVTRYRQPATPLSPASTPQVFMVGRDGRELGAVTPVGGVRPDWAVDGTIAFEDGGQIWTMRIGETPRQVTFRGGASPSWSPSAKRLAFVRAGDVWTVGADGRGLRRVTYRGGDQPAWSPDGRSIAFVRHLPDIHLSGSIYRVRLDRRRAPARVLWANDNAGFDTVRDPAWQVLPRRR